MRVTIATILAGLFLVLGSGPVDAAGDAPFSRPDYREMKRAVFRAHEATLDVAKKEKAQYGMASFKIRRRLVLLSRAKDQIVDGAFSTSMKWAARTGGIGLGVWALSAGNPLTGMLLIGNGLLMGSGVKDKARQDHASAVIKATHAGINPAASLKRFANQILHNRLIKADKALDVAQKTLNNLKADKNAMSGAQRQTSKTANKPALAETSLAFE